MNSLERVSMVINHQEPDRVPVYPMVNSISMKYTGIDYREWTQDPVKCAEAILKATDELDLDVICTLTDLSVEAADWGLKIKYPTNQAAGPDNERLIKEKEDYKKIAVLDPCKTPRMSKHIELAKLLCAAKGEEKPVVGFVFGPLGILSMLRSLDYLMKDMIKDPKIVYAALENITETIIKFSLDLIDAGCHAIMFDTLYASKTIMRPSMWDEFEGVYIERAAKAVHDAGAMVMIHNCGGGIYYDIQIERMHPEAISFLYLPPDCKTMEELKEKYGNQTTLIGHIDPGFLMVCSEEELREQCREQIDTYKKDGGFILATGCEYPAPLDDHFAKVMVEEAKTYGVYEK